MQAWMTLLTQPDYLIGVRTLWRSLQQNDSRYPLVVMFTEAIPETTRRLLINEGCRVREVPALRPRPGIRAHYARAQFSEVWTKLCAWAQDDFSRLVFLDADMLVVKNMDALFTQPLPTGWIAACHACRCNPLRIDRYPADWVPENCFYSHYQPGQPMPRDGSAGYFNSGFMMLTPDKTTYAALQGAFNAIDDLTRYPFPEQDLLNAFFDRRWRQLPYGYNALKTLRYQHPPLWDDATVHAIHFILQKPWQTEARSNDADAALLERWRRTAEGLPDA